MSTSFSRFSHPQSASQPAHVAQVKLLDDNAPGDALPLSPTQNAILREESSDKSPCPRCGDLATISTKHPVCKTCYSALQQQATERQEQQYLVRWLHSRVDATGYLFEDSALVVSPSERVMTLRLLTAARRLGLDWVNLPQTQAFATIMRELLAAYGGGAENDAESGEAATTR